MHTGPLKWVGGEHDFALDIGALRALQTACDAGPEQILRRITAGLWKVDDLYETLRLGLITGESMSQADAAKMVNRLFTQHPLMAFRLTAARVLTAALVGPEDDPLGEAGGEPPPPQNGGSAPFTATEP
jgi:hypothetical protein